MQTGLKQMVSVEEDGLEDVSSDADDNYEAELSDGDNSAPARKPYIDNTELMEGEGRDFRVLGFNKSQRAQFVQILMRYGIGDFDWRDFTSRLKQKSYEEIKAYGTLFLSHISETITDAATFSDGIPKEGLRIEDVLVRIAALLLVRDKVKYSSENPLFTDDIIYRYPALRGLKFWKEEHDRTLLQALLKHGYGKWQAIVDDKDLSVLEKGLNAEYQKEYFGQGDENPNEIRSDNLETVVDKSTASQNGTSSQMTGQIEVISAEELSTAACTDRLAMPHLYNEKGDITQHPMYAE
ncbi:hypothetical protein QVD17_14633 [Tagetes erecta]|uniref:CHD subfamily II SANT-like domain-containing protein n=1 Tax=Tagetes erecta TaxID=13708 RepID=A0AAD8KRP6_TARER|nr:hypothetical protein QVD17_14633 [Tagetes erecta]